MKQLKQSIYKNILSVITQHQFRTSQNMILFSRILTAYPTNKGSYYLTTQRVISYLERGVRDISLMIETMKVEGEDEEIYNTLADIVRNPTITTIPEVVHLTKILSTYLKYANILKVKNTFITSMDMIDDENEENLSESVERVHEFAKQICDAYDVANVSVSQHQFDTGQPELMENVVAHAQDSTNISNVVVTGVRALNTLLSPGYVNGALYVYAALPANYKSGILLESHIDVLRYNDHLKESLNGKRPVSIYISMENNMSQTIKRLWSILYPNTDMRSYTAAEATKMFNTALNSHGFRSVILYYGYREKSTKDIRDIINTFNTDKEQVVAVFFDYIKRVRPGRTDASTLSSEKSELNVIMNEFKSIAVELDIPFITAHQLNRSGAQALDDAYRNRANGNVRSDILLGRSNISVAWEILEVADWLGIINIDMVGDEKYLMIKAAKQREKDQADQSTCIAYRQPFLTPTSFALRTDITENVPLGQPLYTELQQLNYARAQ